VRALADSVPTLSQEQLLWAQGYRLVAGIDEVGRGALAGPVAAAAVILPSAIDTVCLDRVRDSKLLTPRRRETLSNNIYRIALGVGVGFVPPQTIDSLGIVKATRLAMKLAVAQLLPSPDALLIDYFRLPEVSLPQAGVVDGDRCCYSIAGASIVAKVARDRLMARFNRVYPGYGLARNKGYGTAEHLKCLNRLGPSPVHRRSFKPVSDVI
jgi:ribonuclease HII